MRKINCRQDQIDDADNDLQGQIDAGFSKEILSDIETLQNKVNALEGTVVDAKWYAESRTNPRDGVVLTRAGSTSPLFP